MRSTIEAARAANVTVRQLTHWAERGYLRPATELGGIGRGGWRRRWSDADVSDAAMLGALAHALNADILGRFGLVLAVMHNGDNACGMLVEHGNYEVCIEVRAHGTNNQATQCITG